MGFWHFILRRLLFFIPVFLIATLLAFLIIYYLPGNVAVAILGDHATPESVQKLEFELGLDQPILVQYGVWLGGVLRGDWGNSLYRNVPCRDIIMRRLPVTLELVLLAMVWSSLSGIILGIVSVLRPNSAVDFIARLISMLGQSIPNFVLGIMLLLFFSVKLGLLPTYGFVSIFDNPLRAFTTLLLPIIAAGAPGMAIVTRQTRSALLEIIKEDYIKMAFIKGYSKWEVIRRHALKNALIPVLTVISLSFITAMGGSVIIENLFVIPGLGQLVVDSLITKDFPMVLGIILTNIIVVLLANILVDITYKFLDPRIEY